MSTVAQPRRYVSVKELESLYPYHRQTWRRWIREGRLPGCLQPFDHGRVLIPLDEAHALMKRQKKEPAG